VRTVEAYDVAAGKAAVKEAWEHAKSKGEPAVLIFRHPCMLLRPNSRRSRSRSTRTSA